MQTVKAVIETTDANIIAQLQPVIDIVKNYKGHLNKSYWGRKEDVVADNDLINQDNQHKQNLLNAIRPHIKGKFAIGTGSGHIWIAQPDRTIFAETYTGDYILLDPAERWLAASGPDSRVILITDR